MWYGQVGLNVALITSTHSRSLGSSGKAARYTPLAWSGVRAWAKILPHGPRSSNTLFGGFLLFPSWTVACSGLDWLLERFNEPPNSRNRPTNSLILSAFVGYDKNILYPSKNKSIDYLQTTYVCIALMLTNIN